MTSHHIVVVEDEPVTQARLQAYFEQEGYRVSVTGMVQVYAKLWISK
ncbi:TorCAD operon transcriptional regulatory protein torR [Providencia rettgeri]|uniref:TorCAD operon transcriptional regulatory protein torR n=1 Tax=Providencia rettgeri TaxID=587 RepID=A0A379FNL4_PRORE|nr:TorCAD operon transcriptional regulatory protein torR [Providencia rettgeri]